MLFTVIALRDIRSTRLWSTNPSPPARWAAWRWEHSRRLHLWGERDQALPVPVILQTRSTPDVPTHLCASSPTKWCALSNTESWTLWSHFLPELDWSTISAPRRMWTVDEWTLLLCNRKSCRHLCTALLPPRMSYSMPLPVVTTRGKRVSAHDHHPNIKATPSFLQIQLLTKGSTTVFPHFLQQYHNNVSKENVSEFRGKIQDAPKMIQNSLPHSSPVST